MTILKKPAFWIILFVAVACVAAAVLLLTNPTEAKIDGSLAVFLDTAIASHNDSDSNENRFVCTNYKLLDTEKSGSKITLYMWLLYQEYSYDGEPKLELSSHLPIVITANKLDGNDDGIPYELVEYWEPRDGDYYTDDIKSKFPSSLHDKALDSQWCINEQEAQCLKSAQEYYETSESSGPVYLKAKELIFIDGLFSYYIGIDTAPIIKIDEDNSVYELYENEVKSSGVFTSGTLTGDNYDSLFNGAPMWTGFADAAAYKDSISKCLIASELSKKTENGIYPYMLLQSDEGIRYVVYANVDSGVPRSIRWIFSLEETTEPTVTAPVHEEIGSYTFSDSVEQTDPCITLSSGNRFEFTYSAFSSYFAVGSYELTDTTLTLTTDDGENVYVFDVIDDTYVFDGESSSEIPKYRYSENAEALSPVPDGAVFR